MGICCSGGQNHPKYKGEQKIQTINNVNQELPKQDQFSELSGEIQEILDMYLKHEKNSPQHKSLSESSQLKHSLEMPNTPYFKSNIDSDDQFHFLRQAKQLEEISIRLPHKGSDNLPAVQEINQEKQQKPCLMKNHKFQSKCPICYNDHIWFHNCKQDFIYQEDLLLLCQQCNFKTLIREYEFVCLKTSERFKFTANQIEEFFV